MKPEIGPQTISVETSYEIELQPVGATDEWVKVGGTYDSLESLNKFLAIVGAHNKRFSNDWEFRTVRVTVTREVL